MKDWEKLHKIAAELIMRGDEVGRRNGLPYCKNCGCDLVSMGNSIGIISDKLKEYDQKTKTKKTNN